MIVNILLLIVDILLMIGVVFVEGGSLLVISNWNIVRDNMMVIWRDIFFLDFIGR